MTQPTQDTDITSSISPLFDARHNDICGSNVKLAQGRLTSFIMETAYLEKPQCESDATARHQGSELVKSLGETFPWLIKFSKVIQSTVGSKNAKLLDRLLLVYIENISRDVNTCYTKPYRAAKLKSHVSETLIFFHLYWKNIKERVDDHNQYLDRMSEILAMYVDMELKASRRGKDSTVKIAAKLLSAMFIYLDNSEEHIFRVLFRVKLFTKNYREICDPIFKKLFSGFSANTKCITDVTYVRYLLALKLWKKMKDDVQEKKKINELAVAILGQRIPSMPSELLKIIPEPPDPHKNGALWLLRPNSFDLREACDNFIKYETNDHVILPMEPIERLKVIDSTGVPSTQNFQFVDGSQTKDACCWKGVDEEPKTKMVDRTDASVSGEQPVKKIVKLKKFKPLFPKLRPGEVVFIDLTTENEENKQGNGKKEKKKNKKKLRWLKEVRKRSKLKKERMSSGKVWIEKADAHSTRSNEERVKRTSIDWPISEDTVTESTDRIKSAVQRTANRFAKRVTTLNVDSCGAEQVRNKCDTTCKGCDFCSSIDKLKYATERQEDIESPENFVTSQSSPLKNNAMVLLNSAFVKSEIYPQSEIFGQATSCEKFVSCVSQESEYSRAYNPKDSSNVDRAEPNLTRELMKQEPQDIINDSTTDKDCDKIILTDSSSFKITREVAGHFMKRNSPSSIIKLAAEDTVLSTSSNKNKLFFPAARGKLSKIQEPFNETCVVSTTASFVESGTEEQINVISGSTYESMESDIHIGDSNSKDDMDHKRMAMDRRDSDVNLNNNNRDANHFKKEAVRNSRKLFLTSKTYSSVETNKNCHKDPIGTSLNSKLQHSLIHALSLDEMIQIGRDDLDSESENDEREGSQNIAMSQSMVHDPQKQSVVGHNDSDFFQIPGMQLCDDLTSGNEVGNLITASSKTEVDEFENIDILDSILNGDMSMQDILEEQQHLSMTPVTNDPSNNMLGFFTEFFKQPELAAPAKKSCTPDETLHPDKLSKSLPEGSLGTTGILNSLLDSDLTSIDSAPSDFMYSNVQTVDPRLIRKSPTAERAAFLSDFSTVSDLFSQKEASSLGNLGTVESLTRNSKDQLFLDQRDNLDGTDLEEFGLNTSDETDFEMPVLEDLIQLPQHPLIDETIITHISPPSCEPPLSTRSEIMDLNEVKPELSSASIFQGYDGLQMTEDSYHYPKMNNSKEFTSLRLKERIQNPTKEIDSAKDSCPSSLVDFTPPQSVDPPQSPHNLASSPGSAYSQTVSHSPTHSIGTSRHQMFANMLTPPPSVSQSNRRSNSSPSPTSQHNQNLLYEGLNQQFEVVYRARRNAQGGFSKHLPSQPQDKMGSYFCAQNTDSEVVPSLQKQDHCETTRQKPQTKIMCVARSKKNLKLSTESMKLETEKAIATNHEPSICLAQVQVALTRLTSKEINARAHCEQSRLVSNGIPKQEANIPFINTSPATTIKAAQCQLKTQINVPDSVSHPCLQRIDFRKFSITAQQKKPVFVNLKGKTKPALMFERNTQNDKLLKNFHEDVNSRNIMYTLASNVDPATSKEEPYSKLPKVNFTMQNPMGIVDKSQSTNTKFATDSGTCKDTQKISRPRCSMRRVKAQASKSIGEQNSRKTFIIPTTEEPSLKKRKMTPKLLPLLEKEGIIYTVQQTPRDKHSNVLRRDFARKDRAKKKVV